MNESEFNTQSLRELLQYVPKVAGKVFLIDLPWSQYSDSLKSELMLDLITLQSLGVKLMIAVTPKSALEVLDWAIDLDFRLENDVQISADAALEVVNRGQAALVKTSEEGVLVDELVQLVCEVVPDKVLLLTQPFAVADVPQSVARSQWKTKAAEGYLFHDQVSEVMAAGVNRLHVLNAETPGVILSEIFSSEGVGLMIYQNSYRVVRAIQPDDIPELLTMIGRSVRTSLLVPREYEEIDSQLKDYYVYEIDGNVVGCVALHRYANQWGEVACLYVKQGHQGRGYGEDLVGYVEGIARDESLVTLFALTTGAAEFFEGRLGYSVSVSSSIPEDRYNALLNSGRDSLCFVKQLCEKKSFS